MAEGTSAVSDPHSSLAEQRDCT